MTYWNPVLRYGPEAFARDLAAAGGLGVITPDLVPDEEHGWLAATTAHDIAPIFLVAPSSTEQRIASTASVTRGFLYAASTMGVTGARDSVAGTAAALVERVRRHTDLPVGRRAGRPVGVPGERDRRVRRRGDRGLRDGLGGGARAGCGRAPHQRARGRRARQPHRALTRPGGPHRGKALAPATTPQLHDHQHGAGPRALRAAPSAPRDGGRGAAPPRPRPVRPVQPVPSMIISTSGSSTRPRPALSAPRDRWRARSNIRGTSGRFGSPGSCALCPSRRGRGR